MLSINMVTRARSKLNVKQIAALTKVGVYSDSGGLYLRVRTSGRSWFYIGRLNGKRIELGLGSALDVSLARARDKAAAARALILEGRDPREERDRAPAHVPAVVTFGKFAMQFIDDIEDGCRNPKHRQQWRNTLQAYAVSSFDLPITDVNTEHVLAALQAHLAEQAGNGL